MNAPVLPFAPARIFTGDCRVELRKLEAESVNCCITSPPYWGLRDYKVPPSVWGGDPKCEHVFADETTKLELRKGAGLAVLGKRMKGGGHKQAGMAGKVATVQRGFCIHCNAWRGCFGLEPTYQLYLEHMVEIFDEVWRVLRKDGTLWINMGDCYATRPCGWSADRYKAEGWDHTFRDKPFSTVGTRKARGKFVSGDRQTRVDDGVRAFAGGALKPKDLAGMPWRVAFALQDAGWTLRRDVIWNKLNPMPESVYDRPTTSHEYLFQFSKSSSTLCWRHRDGRWVWKKPEPDYRWVHRDERVEVSVEPVGVDADYGDWFRINLWRGFDYYYDFAAIMEPSSPNSHARAARSRSTTHKHANGGPLAEARGAQSIAIHSPVAGRYVPRPAGWSEADGHHGNVHPDGRRREVGVGNGARPTKGVPNGAGHRGRGRPDGTGMERWNAAGPNSRVNVDRVPTSRKLAPHDNPEGPRVKSNDSFDKALGSADVVPMRNKRSVWSLATQPFKEAHFATFPEKLIEPCILAGCPKGGVVLDPFGGSGTVAVVAQRHGRGAVLIEISKEYAAMAERRIAQAAMGPEEKKRATTKASGKVKSASGLPLFSTRKSVVRSANKGASA